MFQQEFGCLDLYGIVGIVVFSFPGEIALMFYQKKLKDRGGLYGMETVFFLVRGDMVIT